RHLISPFQNWRNETVICYLIACSSHLFLKTSLAGTELILSLLKNLVCQFEEKRPDAFLSPQALQNSIPDKMETILARMQLEPKTRRYLICNSCFMTYPYTPEDKNVFKCLNKPTPSSFPCNAVLFKEVRYRSGRSDQLPVRLYLHHELEEWLEQLYSRPEIEDLLDRDFRLDKLSGTSTNVVRDICESPEIQNFLGPDKKPFIRQPGQEGRILFSLNMDGFNPFLNKEAGKKSSIGAIYLVCLFLPPDIRYNIENMFLVGVIPGPKGPSKEQINHILKPLVDDLCILWDPGYYLAATPKYPAGRLIIGAVVILVCDLLASRQMSGCASHSSNNFCSFCHLKSKDLGNFDFQNWPKRTMQQHIHLAEEWRSANTEADRKRMESKNGIRWSELLRLPYWDPTRFVVIDVMHSFFLNILKYHVRDIWGMDAKANDVDPYYSTLQKNYSHSRLNSARDALQSGNYSELKKARAVELRQLCRERNIPYGGRKQLILATLIQHISGGDVDLDVLEDEGNEDDNEDDDDVEKDKDDNGPLDDDDTSSGRTQKRNGCIIGKQTLEEIRNDMASMSLPTWVSLCPKRPGESKTGKLSADQWRTFCTINLVVTLGRLWNQPRGDGPIDEVQERKRAMFVNFMHLVSAVRLGTMRSMNPERIKAYIYHMQSYLTTLRALYPWTGITPYQHLSLHLPDMLARFGPSIAWSCWANIQFTHPNRLYRIGDLERTIFLTFCKAQILRLLFHKTKFPAAMHPMIEKVKQHLFKSAVPDTGTLAEGLFVNPACGQDFDRAKATALSPTWHSLLIEWVKHFAPYCDIASLSSSANILKLVKRRDETFSTYFHSSRNSMVYYRQLNGKRWPARIVGIFVHQRPSGVGFSFTTETFFILENFRALPHPLQEQNAFTFEQNQYLFENSFYNGQTIASLQDVLYHFVSYPYWPTPDVEALLALPLPRLSISALRQDLKREAREKAYDLLKTSPRWAQFKELETAYDFHNFHKTVEKVDRHKASILVKIRTRHFPLNDYLYKRKLVPSNACEQCRAGARETLRHYLLECTAFNQQRNRLWTKTGQRHDFVEDLLATPDRATALIEYVEETGRFPRRQTNLLQGNNTNI
ncbi:hypothetical protein CVT24_003288, partial [Panaeolus cyanescens]